MHRSNPQRNGGFILADAVMGLVIVGILTASLTVLMGRYRHASRRMSEMRAAVAVAEHAVGALQAGQPPPPPEGDQEILLRPLDVEGTPPRLRWVRITVIHHDQQAELTALVPARTVVTP